MKNLILLFLLSVSLVAQSQPDVRGRRVVLQEGGTANDVTLNNPVINGTVTGDAGLVTSADLAAATFPASAITSGTLDEARLGSGTPNITKVLRGDGTWSGELEQMTLVGPTRREGTIIDMPVDHGTSTTVIWDVQAGIFQKLTLSGATTIVLTNRPTASDETLYSQLTITGNGSHDVQFLNIDLFTLVTRVDTNNLAAGETKFFYEWSGAVGSFGQSPEPPPQAYLPFVFPSMLDGVGATAVTNSYATLLWGKAVYSGSADTNGNYALFDLGPVPYELNTGKEITLKNLGIRVAGTDTDAAEFTIALWQPASSSAYSPTDFTSLSTFVNFDSGALSSPAANDIFYISDITWTGAAAALTTGRPFVIGIARRNGSNDDAITITGGVLSYWRTQ